MRQQDRTTLEYHMDRDKAMGNHIVDCLTYDARPNFPPVPARTPILTQQTIVCTAGLDLLKPETTIEAGNPPNTRSLTTKVKWSTVGRNLDVVTVTAAVALSRAADLASRLATAKTQNTTMTQTVVTVNTLETAHHTDGRAETSAMSIHQPNHKDSPGVKAVLTKWKEKRGKRGSTSARKPC